MSTAPMLEGSAGKLKTFWQRPEGKVGIVALGGLIGGAGLMFWGSILPWLVTMMADTLHLTYLTIGVVGTLLVVFNKTFQSRVALAFRLLMRWITGIFVELNPIAIAQDRVQEMKKRQRITEDQISTVSGQIRSLKEVIAQNENAFSSNLSVAAKAQERAQAATDQNERMRMEFQKVKTTRAANRLQQSNITYKDLLATLQKIYNWLQNLSVHTQFVIDDTEDSVKQATIKAKAVGSAYKAMQQAMSIIKGNPDEVEIYDMAMEKMADDANTQLGIIEDLQRVSQNFIDTIDLQNGAVETKALQNFEQYEQKLLTAGTPDSIVLQGAKPAIPVPVKGYDDLFRK